MNKHLFFLFLAPLMGLMGSACTDAPSPPQDSQASVTTSPPEDETSPHSQPECGWASNVRDTLYGQEMIVRKLNQGGAQSGLWVLENKVSPTKRYQPCQIPNVLKHEGMPIQVDLVVYHTVPHYRMFGAPAKIHKIIRTPIR